MLLATTAETTRVDRRPRPDPGDVVRAGVAALLSGGVSWALHDRSGRGFDRVTVAVIVLTCAPIVLWRFAPAVVAALVMASAAAGVSCGLPVSGALMLALVLVGLAAARARARQTATLALLSGVGVAVAAVATADSKPALALLGGFAVGTLPVVFGERLRVERARAQAATELATRVEELRDRDVRRAVVEERLRIARDVHDITGHHLSAISLQAAGAARGTADPVGRAALEAIHRVASDALGQTRRVLGILRADDEAPALAPPPRLAHLEPLLATARSAGVAAGLETSGDARELPDTVEMCAYRVVQESLTNVVRHAHARSVRVVVAYEPAALRIVIEDDGIGAGGGRGRDESGIQGMRERVALVGGALAAGPGAGGGWTVTATIPLQKADR